MVKLPAPASRLAEACSGGATPTSGGDPTDKMAIATRLRLNLNRMRMRDQEVLGAHHDDSEPRRSPETG